MILEQFVDSTAMHQIGPVLILIKRSGMESVLFARVCLEIYFQCFFVSFYCLLDTLGISLLFSFGRVKIQVQLIALSIDLFRVKLEDIC